MFRKSLILCCAFFLTASLSFGADAKSPIEDDSWDDFIGLLARKYNAVITEYQKSGWPKAATVLTPYDDSAVGVICCVFKKNGEIRVVNVYYAKWENIGPLNIAAEADKMAVNLINFCETVRKMDVRGLLGNEQIDFVWSESETSATSMGQRFADRVNELIESYKDKWLKLEPLLDQPVLFLYFADGKKHFAVGVLIYNPAVFNVSERWVVAKYPLEEINDKNLTEKAKDALEKITIYLTEKPYAKTSGLD